MRNIKIIHIPTPSASEVEKYLKQWKSLENYVLQERALDKLFHDICAHNNDIRDILLKCSTLNDFYSTNIYSIFPVAKHILSLDIDNRLAVGDLSLVNDIATVEISGKKKNFYSFASKYCSHHNSDTFAIYDAYVDRCLVHFNKLERFSNFRKRDLKDYCIFNKAIYDFRKHYRLERYSLKEIDQYLWQLGKEFFPKKY